MDDKTVFLDLDIHEEKNLQELIIHVKNIKKNYNL